jgi:hypothetical protein
MAVVTASPFEHRLPAEQVDRWHLFCILFLFIFEF